MGASDLRPWAVGPALGIALAPDILPVCIGGDGIHGNGAGGVERLLARASSQGGQQPDEESGEHVLQIAGTHERPAPGTHIGVLANRKTCGLAFDLVADERVNGASEDRR